MKHAALFFALLFSLNCSAQFSFREFEKTWDTGTYLSWGSMFLAGVAHGTREAYHADPFIFERMGASPTSFFGSDAWKRNYFNNDPAQGHKHEYLGNFGRDIWHTAGMTSTTLFAAGTFTIGARKYPIKYRIANILGGIVIRSISASLTYNILRGVK